METVLRFRKMQEVSDTDRGPCVCEYILRVELRVRALSL